ncbi:MAG: hypothetical protein PHR24_00950 [Oscillospiraceae bacterium]|nr:hypothetical protein [Oscillospiraceae bacterium]MDD3833506.1 hypothetical protein [Oscillospiraceae bacterium]MDD4545846.1 hypothetical protein [Oscillospiraceae bacterium]
MRGCFSSCKAEEESGDARRRQQRCMAENRPQRCLDFYLRSVLYIFMFHT